MEIEQKANKVIRPASIYTLSAEETNQITTELQNVITAGGLTPSSGTLTQVRDAIDNLISDATTGEWQKPADWVDIRSGAPENSIIFLVGHKADYSAYDTVSFIASLSNTAHTYDVFIDGVYYNSYNSGATFELNWSTAGITTGRDVTYPEALRTHTVMISATDLEHDTITAITSARPTGTASDINYQYGTLWAHFEISNAIDVRYLFARYATEYWTPNLEAITAKNDKLTCIDLRGFFGKGLDLADRVHSGPKKISYLPEIDLNGASKIGYGAFNVSNQYEGNLKEIRISNGLFTAYGGACNGLFSNIHSLKRITLKDANIGYGARVFFRCDDLEQIPSHFRIFGAANINMLDMFTGIKNAAPTVISFAQPVAHAFGYIRCGGSSASRLDWLKGLILNTNMTLGGASPQINVSYTGLDRQALVTMFNSMPTVSNSQVCNITGATGAADLTAEDLAIATNKGWTVTR